MSRNTKRMNQTIRNAQQKLELPLMYKYLLFIMTLCDKEIGVSTKKMVNCKSRKATTEIL